MVLPKFAANVTSIFYVNKIAALGSRGPSTGGRWLPLCARNGCRNPTLDPTGLCAVYRRNGGAGASREGSHRVGSVGTYASAPATEQRPGA